MAAGKHGGKHIKIYDKDAPKRVTKAEKAGLIFPVSRMDRYLRKMHGKKYRIGETTPIYLAAVVEYLIAEVVELAGNAARDNNKQRIKGRHIMLAVSNDEELRLLLKHVTISEGGVMPNIHPSLLPGARDKRQYKRGDNEADDSGYYRA